MESSEIESSFDDRLQQCCKASELQDDGALGETIKASESVDLIDLMEKCDVTPENLQKDESWSAPSTSNEDDELFSLSLSAGGKREQQLGKQAEVMDSSRGHSGLLIILDDDINTNQNIDQICDKIGFVNTGITGNNSLLILEDGDELVERNSSANKQNQAMAFTIDFDDTRAKNFEEKQQKYEKMFERFQNKRHRRGVSMSKFEDEQKSSSSESPQPSSNVTNKRATKTPSSVKLPRKVFPEVNKSSSQAQMENNQLDDDAKVRLRDKKNALKNTEISKRHSWGPKTISLIESQPVPEPPPPSKPLPQPSSTKFQAKSSVLAKVLDANSNSRTVIESIKNKPDDELPTIDLLCLAPPLELIKAQNDEDVVSEAGTYTLDGDNYTEEQKQMMDIDKLAKEAKRLKELKQDEEEEVTFLKCSKGIPTTVKRPITQFETLEIIDLDIAPSEQQQKQPVADGAVQVGNNNMGRNSTSRSGARNVLEISCIHDESMAVKPKISYLEKIKSKVKNLGVKTTSRTSIEPEKKAESPDVGTFTSITTSGILSYKPTLESNPRHLVRRNSLTKSQIDNSEYVQGISRVNLSTDEKIMDSITDSDKLNNLLCRTENEVQLMSKSAIKTAATKNDWIHEWAKNARKNTSEMSRSFTVDSHVHQLKNDNVMTRSDCYQQDNYGHTGSGREGRNKSNKPNKPLNIGEFEFYSSDSNLKPNFVRPSAHNLLNENSPLAQIRMSARRRYSNEKSMNELLGSPTKRPPISPSKIPSPVHTIGRSTSRNRSHQGSMSDLSNVNTNDTDVYLQKTAAAISTLQTIHLNNSIQNSPNGSPSGAVSPNYVNKTSSPKISPLHSLSPRSDYNIIEECENKMSRIQQLHKRNLSLDSTEHASRLRYPKSSLYQTAAGVIRPQNVSDIQKKQHIRHHSYEGMQQNAKQTNMRQMYNNTDFDQTEFVEEEVASQQQNTVNQKRQKGVPKKGLISNPSPNSPIRRSSSFSVKPMTQNISDVIGCQSKAPLHHNSIKKSASSTSFKKHNLYDDNGDLNEIYVNDDDDLDPAQFTSDSELSGGEFEEGVCGPITNTRCNKAFLMRMEQNKVKPESVKNAVNMSLKQGVMACPNTPEMRRRQPMLRAPVRDRASMPRDSSLNRMKQDLKSNLSNTKKSLTSKSDVKSQALVAPSTPTQGRVQPKYLDISKYKPTTAVNFLKKDESKSYLIKAESVKRSPSSASVGLTRTDPTRMSNRSVKSAGMKPSQKKEINTSVKQQTKEQELAMWKRRASYDPMKAAMEGKRKQEEAKRLAQQQQSKLSESSVVLRSQSFHSGVTQCTSNLRSSSGGGGPASDLIDDESNPDSQNRWTITSTESSDDDF